MTIAAAPSSSPQITRARLLEQVLQTSCDHPIFTEAVSHACAMLGSADCRISLLAAALQWDPRLAAKLLSIANSALYAPPKPIDRLDEAIVLIGLRELRSVVLAAATADFVSQLSFSQQRLRNALCHHGCLTAIVSRRLSQALQLNFQGEDFTAGLLHDIGRLLLASFEPSFFTDGRAEEPPDNVARERQILGIDHCELGQAFCQAQNLPKSLTRGVAYHHLPMKAPSHRPLVALVAAADYLAVRGAASRADEPYEPAKDAELPAMLAPVIGSSQNVAMDWLRPLLSSACRQAATMTLLFTCSDPRR